MSSNLTSPTTLIGILFVHIDHLKWQKRQNAAWPFLLAGIITWCSGYPATLPEVKGLAIDKIGHFGLYGALATAIVRHPALGRFPWMGLWWALPLASAYGLGDEFRQSFTTVRMFEWDDWIADTLGAATAVTLYLRWSWYRRLMETPVIRRKRPSVPCQSEIVPVTSAGAP